MKSEKEINTGIGLRLKKIRDFFLLTQPVMGRILKVSTSHYSRMERGMVFPGADSLKILKETLDINPDWLFSGSGNLFTTGFFKWQFNEMDIDNETAKTIEVEPVSEKERKQIQDLFYLISEDRVAYHNIMAHFYRLKAGLSK